MCLCGRLRSPAIVVDYREGQKSQRMMTVAVHDRLTGRPGRASGFERFIDYVASRRRVWICRGVDIARHWHSRHPYSRRSEGAG
jgi:peptidoglycan/xylan/chitin deacetylase (PgdA/CDA1 family)